MKKKKKKKVKIESKKKIYKRGKIFCSKIRRLGFEIRLKNFLYLLSMAI